MARAKKKARRLNAWLLFEDECGVSERPTIRRTWSPVGETPVLIHSWHWHRRSICAVLAFHPRHGWCELRYETTDGSYNIPKLQRFLLHLRALGGRVILVWDRLRVHVGKTMAVFLEQQRNWLETVALPGHAPDLNPTEYLWNNIKGGELANRCVIHFDELTRAIHLGMNRVKRTPSLLWSFLAHAGFSL